MRNEEQIISDQIASIHQNSYSMSREETFRELDKLHKQREALQSASASKFSLEQKKQLNTFYTNQIHALRQKGTQFISSLADQARAINCNVTYTEVVAS